MSKTGTHFCILVAELGIAPRATGYEPVEILLLHSAILYILQRYLVLCNSILNFINKNGIFCYYMPG